MSKLIQLSMALIMLFSFTNCAVICGSSSYNARIQTNDPDVKIYYNGMKIGTEEGVARVARKDANDVTFVLKKDGYKDQKVSYHTSTLRGWSIFGTVVTWGLVGVIVDGVSGAWWKPDVNEATIQKQDYKNYIYNIDFDTKEAKL